MVASNETFIIAAYAVTWVVILGYLWRLVRMEGRANAEYERVAPAPGQETSR